MTEQLSVSNQKEVPKHKAALQEKYDKEPKEVEKDLTSEEKLSVLEEYSVPSKEKDAL